MTINIQVETQSYCWPEKMICKCVRCHWKRQDSQGKEELKSLKVVTRGRKSMKFRMHNTMTGEIGDGTMDQRGINYGDVLRLYPQQNRGTARHSQGQPSHHKVDKSQKSPKLN